MSCNNWEEGTIRLPSAEFARLRKVVEVADRTRKERVFAQSQTFWKGLTRKQQTDPGEYAKAADAFTERLRTDGGRPASSSFRSWQPERPGPNADISNDLSWKLRDVTRGTYGPGGVFTPGNVRRVLPTDMGYPTNRTTNFRCGEGGISFDKDTSSVHWSTGENNRAVESAHDHPTAQVFFAELGGVQWTRGTGGHFTGNDEYNEDNREAGGGGNYVTTGFGPLGAGDPDAYNKTDEYTDSTGKRVRRADFPGAKVREKQWKAMSRAYSGGQSRKPKGVPVGGRFTTSARGETGTWLY